MGRRDGRLMSSDLRTWVLAPRLHVYFQWGDHAVYAVGIMSTPVGQYTIAVAIPEHAAMALMNKLGLQLTGRQAMAAAAHGELAGQRAALVHDPLLAEQAGLHVVQSPASCADRVCHIYNLAALEAHGQHGATEELNAMPPQWRTAIEGARSAWAETLVHDVELGAAIVKKAKARAASHPTHAHGATGHAAAHGIPAHAVDHPHAGHARPTSSGQYLGGQPPPAWAQKILAAHPH